MSEEKKLTVREIREMAKKGEYEKLSDELWYDWFCSDKALLGKTKRLTSMLSKIKNPKVLDNYTVWFKNNCPMCGPLYDDMRFEPLKADKTEDERNGRYFVVVVKDAREDHNYVVWSEKDDVKDFGADTTKDAFEYVDKLVKDFKF